MSSKHSLLFGCVSVSALFLATGCASTRLDGQALAPAPIVQATPRIPAATPGTTASAVQDLNPAARSTALDAAQPAPSRRSVYFDFDDILVHPEYFSVITANGAYLGAHPRRHVRIEGNCDERGSREYNLALGQRRADAIRQRLILLGMLDDQAETVSFGEEKPRAPGHDERAWAQNRRADIVYQ